ncbi:MAG: NAD(P)H-binding protein [Anaerolineae bacterium]|nr:NAD(P)H-binding protein [Anaerolineae bacterium]
MTRQPILVLGGTGHYGRRIVENLVARGEPVRVLSRNARAARTVLGLETEIVEGDVVSRDSVAKVLEGARAVVVAVSAMNPKTARIRMRIERDGVLHVIDQASQVGCSRVVYLSGYDVREEFVSAIGVPLEFARPMLDVQVALSASSLNWTVLGCAPSMELFFALIRRSTMIVPGGGPPALPTISSHDVGKIAAQAVMRHDLSGRHLRLAGPEAFSFPEAAQRISQVWGKPVRFRAIPLLPLRIASALTRPFSPYLHLVFCAVNLMNHFPHELAAQVPSDHRFLRELFDYVPTTLEVEAEHRHSG